MNSLTTSTLYADGITLSGVSQSKGLAMMKQAMDLAEGHGYRNYRDGEFEVPMFYKTFPDLEQCWLLGQLDAIAFESHFSQTIEAEV